MNVTQNSQAPTINEQQIEVFNFSETQSEIRSVLIEGNPYFVASDIAIALGYANARKALADHCKGVTKRYIPTKGGTQSMNVIPESDVYRLIINSQLPAAEKFERWVMEEVLPTIRKKGYYKVQSRQQDFLDARDIPYQTENINSYGVTVVFVNEKLFQITDLCRSIRTTTESTQIVRKLNAKRTLAWKVWLFGKTSPSWFTNELGKSLLFLGSRIEKQRIQLALPFPKEGGVA